jgi:hypothetical protein
MYVECDKHQIEAQIGGVSVDALDALKLWNDLQSKPLKKAKETSA